MNMPRYFTLPETNVFAPENRPKPNRKVVFQPSIFRSYKYVCFMEGIYLQLFYTFGVFFFGWIPEPSTVWFSWDFVVSSKSRDG